MAANPITRPGQINGAGADDALFQRQFAGEVLTSFHQTNQFMPLHRVRTLSNAKSATFPVTGTASAKYHTLGESVYGTDDGQVTTYLNSILSKEREIWVDDPLIAPVFVGSIEEMKNNYDHRSIYSTELGVALADQADANILSTIFAAASALPDFNPMTLAEKVVTTYTDARVGSQIAAFAFQMKALFNQRNIPKEGRILALRPTGYSALAQLTDLVNKDYTSSPGDYNKNEIMTVAGFRVVESNSFGSTAEATTGVTGIRNAPWGTLGQGYNADWTQCGALAFQTSAVGTVKMKELGIEQERSIERRGHLIIADYVMGHNILRPECAALMEVTAGQF